MSLTESWAISVPSAYSTSECTRLSGWTMTSMRSPGIRRGDGLDDLEPLFIMVAESTVILAPIFHVGWRAPAPP